MEWANIYAAGAQVSLVSDLLRMVSFTLDSIIYRLIPLVYNAIKYLYDISSLIDASNVLSTAKKSIYSLLAIFMFFKLAFSLLGMLVDTSMIDNKEKGAGKLVSNVMVCLILIVAVPYIFQYAKMAQTKIIENQLIEKAIYGKDFNSGGGYELGNRLSLAAWSIFLQPTTDTGLAVDAYNGIFSQVNEENGFTSFKWLGIYATLNFVTGIPVLRTILKIFPGVNGVLNMFGNSGTHYQLSYIIFFSTAVGIYLLWSMFKMCIDVAYRSLKLLALELLSPIAIISYIDPKSSKDGVFAKWLKECVKTYTSLFVRIFVLAFVSLLLSEINITNTATVSGTFLMTPFIKLMYILAIIAFIKTAPKFIDGIFGTELSKESETKGATNLLKALGFGVSTMAMGGIRGGVVAKRTGQSVLKGAAKGGWQGLMAGFESGNKNGFNMRGVIGAFTNTWSGINKEHGYEYDKEYYRDLERMKGHVDGVNEAKQKRSFGFDSEAAYKRYATLPADKKAKMSAREYVESEERTLQQQKHAAYLEYLYKERKTKAGTSYNLAYLANNATAEEEWAKAEAVKAQTDYLASKGELSEGYARIVAYQQDAKLEATMAGYVKQDAQAEYRSRMDNTGAEEKAKLVEKYFTAKASEIRAKTAGGGTLDADDIAELRRCDENIALATADKDHIEPARVSAAFEEVVDADWKARTRSDRMVIRHKDGTTETVKFGGLGIGLWTTATANKETDSESAKDNLDVYAKSKEGAKDKRNNELFNKAKTARDAERYKPDK